MHTTVDLLRFALILAVPLLTVLTAILTFWGTSQTSAEQSRVRDWFRQRWLTIRNSSWLTLPELVVLALVRLSERIRSIGTLLYSQVYNAMLTLPFFVFIGQWSRTTRLEPVSIGAFADTIAWCIVAGFVAAVSVLAFEVPELSFGTPLSDRPDLRMSSTSLVYVAFTAAALACVLVMHYGPLTIVLFVISTLYLIRQSLQTAYHFPAILVGLLICLTITRTAEAMMPKFWTHSWLRYLIVTLLLLSSIRTSIIILKRPHANGLRIVSTLLCSIVVGSSLALTPDGLRLNTIVCFLILVFVNLTALSLILKAKATPFWGLFALVYTGSGFLAMWWYTQVVSALGHFTGAILAAISIPHYAAFSVVFIGSVASVIYRLRGSRELPVHLEVPLTLLGCSFGVSVLVTSLAYWMGQIVDRHTRHADLSVRMIISNVLFDGLTIASVLYLFRRVTPQPPVTAVPIAVGASVVVGSVFACLSLWCGLAGTPNGLNVSQVLRVLVAHAPSDHRWDLGPYFWMMHTTFLPTLTYAVLVGVAWCAKVTATTAEWLLGRAQHEDINPLRLTAGLVGLITALMTATLVGLNQIR